jgi:hypothetical protein
VVETTVLVVFGEIWDVCRVTGTCEIETTLEMEIDWITGTD